MTIGEGVVVVGDGEDVTKQSVQSGQVLGVEIVSQGKHLGEKRDTFFFWSLKTNSKQTVVLVSYADVCILTNTRLIKTLMCECDSRVRYKYL